MQDPAKENIFLGGLVAPGVDLKTVGRGGPLCMGKAPR